ncbi:Ryncolin-2,Ryncolin-4,Ficolin-1,Techylectin-5A,Ficolin-1-A,Ficolin-2,Ryncolin-1,Tenascin-R,Ryncolin-3,Ficolin-1-B [Mytilus coruscus]|uniref:Ryncolin-2,Ryncolin-4,Ficolin-1,Techylectin-5A,Fi colin-1-A,Ficolin-2,Ryncolin-1,Tenascin-R,Ryncolin-3,Ficoli n-1-B n=1 Tax=Mytilus coruscus TaxID=42192 RepID=A0A6J8AFW0_MYTCO|nr:Ryncolin-2,Ryncolin-4,Ficolin-1,Techylectin-5A,Ficolin-1-A,Ficolin-2,Ryncolin-1,Tenascin-R,Ryncolin-3,Ficolin-1-B [Mytilus coruscus]
MYRKLAILCLLQLFCFISGQVTEEQTTLSHVTEHQKTDVTTVDKVTALEAMVKTLQSNIEELKTQRKTDQIHYGELENRLILTHAETVTLHSDVIQLLQTKTEIENKITMLDESVGDLQLQSEQFNFIQKQLQKDIGSWLQLKDNTRRSQRRLEKRLKAKIETLDKKTGAVLQDLLKTKENCSEYFEKSTKDAAKFKIFIQNNTEELRELITNQTALYTPLKKETIGKRFDKLYKIYNISRPVPDRSKVFQSSENTNGIESEFQISHSVENKLWNEVGSGEEGSGSTIPILTAHSHNNYVQKNDLLLELQERDVEITTLLDMYENLKQGLSVMEGRIQEIRLGNFMERLQESFINFTQNVLTMDQWRMASGQLINSTQVNQQHIAGLTSMIFNNTNFLRELDMKISHAQSLSYQQFSLLRIHIIQLNNTVQDMKEEWNRKGRNKNTQHIPPPVYVHTIQNDHQNTGTLLSRIEDIALQVVYNENRIAKMELKILNESLLECKKVNTDLYQDARMMQIENSVVKMSEASHMVKEILNQVQRDLYQEYAINKNQSDVINVIIRDINKIDHIFPQITSIQHQINFFQFMLPEDCYGYHRRGYKDSGVYIINPVNTNLSIQVYCDLEDGDTGWTLIQRRMDGMVDFNRRWQDYKFGFGTADSEFWLGNDLIHMLTTSNTMLKIEMIDKNNVRWTVIYDQFSIAPEQENYKISISGFHGNNTDSLSYSNEMGFSTFDRDNDGSSTHCAMFYTAGWWYKHCHYSNLNGRFRLGMVWYDFNEDKWIQLKYTSMKIKPNL